MFQKGQVTVFVTIGILLLIITASFISFKSYSKTQREETAAEQVQSASQLSAPIRGYIESCITKTGNEAVLFVGKQGGYYELPELADTQLELPYYFYENQNRMISKEELGRQISRYMDNELFFCLQNFAAFEKEGFNIESGEIKTETRVNPTTIAFKVNLPLEVITESVQKEMNTFSVSISSNLGKRYALIQKFMEIQVAEPQSVCISCLVNLGIDDNLRMVMSPLDAENVTFMVIGQNELANEDHLEYDFLARYDFQ